MNRLFTAALIATTLSLNTMADESAFELQQAQENTVVTFQVQDVTDRHPEISSEMFENNVVGRLNQAGAVLTAADVVVDKIINIGTKIWQVVEKGQAVYNFSAQTATGLPKKARSWDQLQNWQSPTSRVYEVLGYNVFGAEILRFEYRILLLYGGNVSGIGRYIGYASVQPATVSIPFLTDFNVNANVESVYNKGTRSNPLAAMILNVNIAANSKIPLVAKKALGFSYELDGNGLIRPIRARR